MASRGRPAGTVPGVRVTDLPTWPVAAGSLALGFGVAQATGVRPLGGLVLVAGAGWCARRWRERAGTERMWLLLGVYLAAFVLSHLIAHPLGAWVSVALVSAIAGGAAWALADTADGRLARPARTL